MQRRSLCSGYIEIQSHDPDFSQILEPGKMKKESLSIPNRTQVRSFRIFSSFWCRIASWSRLETVVTLEMMTLDSKSDFKQI